MTGAATGRRTAADQLLKLDTALPGFLQACGGVTPSPEVHDLDLQLGGELIC